MNEIEKLCHLEEHEIEILADFTAESGARVIEYDVYRCLQLDGFEIQSVMDKSRVDRLVNPVNVYMSLSLLYLQDTTNIMNLGLGGAGLERFFSRHFAESNMISVEANEIVIHLAREYFQLPETAQVFHADAFSFVAACNEEFDLILCDLFEDETLPEFMLEESFYAALEKNLSRTGVVSINTIAKDEQDLLLLLKPLRNHLPHIKLIKLKDHHNVILLAMKQAPDINLETLSKKREFLQQILALDLSELYKDIISLPDPL